MLYYLKIMENYGFSCYDILNIYENATEYEIHDAYYKSENKNDERVFNAYNFALELYNYKKYNYDKNTLKMYESYKIND